MYPYNLEHDGDEKQHLEMNIQSSEPPEPHIEPEADPISGQKVPEPGSFPGYGPEPGSIPGPGTPGFRPGPRPGTPGFGPGSGPVSPGFRPGFDERPPYGQAQQPPGRPPERTPEKRASLYAVDPGAIRNCLFQYTYVWLINGNSFWMYPTFVGRRSVSGYRWTKFGWTYIGIDLNLIETFLCVPFK